MLSRVRALFPLPSSNFATIVDSFGSRLAEQPSDAHLRTLNTSLDPEASEHTLLLAPATDGQMQSLSVLFGNAKKVTVLSPTTLSERAGLNQLPLHHQPSEVRIEAARTRIGRYSRECQRLHLMTWEAAAKIINKVDATFDGVWGAARPFAETWLSDELFFEALKASSVAKLIRDENFDRIVVAVDGSPASAELCGVLGTVEGFASDPRVVVASLALTENARLRFGDEISAILGNAHGAPNKRRALVSSAIVDMLKVRGKELVGGFKQFPVAGRPRILFATAPEPSYNAASASYFLELQKNYDCIFSSINPGVSSQIDYDTSGEVQHISQPVSNNADLALWLYTAIDEVEIDTETPRLVANILRSKGRSFAQHSISGVPPAMDHDTAMVRGNGGCKRTTTCTCRDAGSKQPSYAHRGRSAAKASAKPVVGTTHPANDILSIRTCSHRLFWRDVRVFAANCGRRREDRQRSLPRSRVSAHHWRATVRLCPANRGRAGAPYDDGY